MPTIHMPKNISQEFLDGYAKGLADGSPTFTLLPSLYEDLYENSRKDVYDALKEKLVSNLAELFQNYDQIVKDFIRDNSFEYRHPANQLQYNGKVTLTKEELRQSLLEDRQFGKWREEKRNQDYFTGDIPNYENFNFNV